jgi:3-methyladenine DNA glycosylase AlkC
MSTLPTPRGRRVLCRLSEIPSSVRELLCSGTTETASWTEWMATDMSSLARTIASQTSHCELKSALLEAADSAYQNGILARLAILGSAVNSAVSSFEDAAFWEIRGHRCDVVRQWGVYAVNAPSRKLALADRLKLTLPFAADHHMSVRECAWMAFRPHLVTELDRGLTELTRLSQSEDANIRRFSVEVCRPRSVWGTHIASLKANPERAAALLENVKGDSSRYVRLSVGNWLNDASKSRPDWVRGICKIWSKNGHRHTQSIIRRGMRTLERDSRPRKALRNGASGSARRGSASPLRAS